MGQHWEVSIEPGQPAHVIPIGDLKPHTETADCWCKPWDDEGVLVHNAMDRREYYERGQLKQI